MKKSFFLLLALACFISLSAQEAGGTNNDGEMADKKNILKVNLLALPFRNFSFQYERAIGRKITAGATFRFMPKGGIPLKSTIEQYADDPEVTRQLGSLQTGNYAIMPELRFYLGRKGAFRGFYLAPFASIARYTADLNFEYDDAGTVKVIPLSGSVNTVTGGLMLGAQWKLGGRIYLDWWLLGPNYGTSSGTISGKKSLNLQEQQSVRDELDQLDIPLTKFTYTVDGNGATVNIKGPWAGIRSGLCIGFSF